MENKAMRAFKTVPASKSTLTNPSEFVHAIKKLKVDKVSGPEIQSCDIYASVR
jgi:hypothetical protein